jgi:hypothetical protein
MFLVLLANKITAVVTTLPTIRMNVHVVPGRYRGMSAVKLIRKPR